MRSGSGTTGRAACTRGWGTAARPLEEAGVEPFMAWATAAWLLELVK